MTIKTGHVVRRWCVHMSWRFFLNRDFVERSWGKHSKTYPRLLLWNPATFFDGVFANCNPLTEQNKPSEILDMRRTQNGFILPLFFHLKAWIGENLTCDFLTPYERVVYNIKLLTKDGSRHSILFIYHCSLQLPKEFERTRMVERRAPRLGKLPNKSNSPLFLILAYIVLHSTPLSSK